MLIKDNNRHMLHIRHRIHNQHIIHKSNINKCINNNYPIKPNRKTNKYINNHNHIRKYHNNWRQRHKHKYIDRSRSRSRRNRLPKTGYNRWISWSSCRLHKLRIIKYKLKLRKVPRPAVRLTLRQPRPRRMPN